MPRVDFYILQDENRSSLQHFACRLADKAYQQGHRILIQTENAEDSRILDDLLWTFNDNSFLPHALQNMDNMQQQPIVISHDANHDDSFRTMINLSSTTPENTDKFERIAEILNQQEDRKQAGRRHYKLYKDKGYELYHHDMKS